MHLKWCLLLIIEIIYSLFCSRWMLFIQMEMRIIQISQPTLPELMFRKTISGAILFHSFENVLTGVTTYWTSDENNQIRVTRWGSSAEDHQLRILCSNCAAHQSACFWWESFAPVRLGLFKSAKILSPPCEMSATHHGSSKAMKLLAASKRGMAGSLLLVPTDGSSRHWLQMFPFSADVGSIKFHWHQWMRN